MALLAAFAPAGAAGDDEHFVAVATSPTTTWSFDATEEGHYGFGWHKESSYDAGLAAEAECRKQGGEECSYTADGGSMRGGCVGLALARWRDEGRGASRAYVASASTFRHRIAGSLRGKCSARIFSGKHRETVTEHGCEIIRVLCAEDLGTGEVAAAGVRSSPVGGEDAAGVRSSAVEGDDAATVPRCADWNTADFFRNATGASVQRCLDAGSDANARDEAGWTPLRFAAQAGSPDAVRVLLQGSAALDAQDEHGNTPLLGAAFGNRATTVRILLDAGADANGPDAPLSSAVSGVHDINSFTGEQTQDTVDTVKALLARGADPNRGDPDLSGMPPLISAVKFATMNANTVRIVRALLAAGADPDGAGASEPPLQAVACRSNLPNEYDVVVVDALLEAGADPNRRRDNGWTTLYCAVPSSVYPTRSMGNVHMVRIIEALLDAGADPSLSSSSSEDYLWLPIDNLDNRDSALWGTEVHRRLERAANEARGRRAASSAR